MDQIMIQRWNARVAVQDVVYHVGDFAFGDHNEYLSKLKGHKVLILGNHDHPKDIKRAKGWQSMHDMLTIKINGKDIVLCHYAMRTWNKRNYGALHFYGHSHGKLPGDTQSTDVGVDCWDFEPVSLEEIMVRLTTDHKIAEHAA